jgi:hypothetical protein
MLILIAGAVSVVTFIAVILFTAGGLPHSQRGVRTSLLLAGGLAIAAGYAVFVISDRLGLRKGPLHPAATLFGPDPSPETRKTDRA